MAPNEVGKVQGSEDVTVDDWLYRVKREKLLVWCMYAGGVFDPGGPTGSLYKHPMHLEDTTLYPPKGIYREV